MTDKHELENLMRSTMENLRDMIDVNTVIGDVVETSDGTSIVPISKVSFGFASGGSEFGNSTTLRKEEEKYPFVADAVLAGIVYALYDFEPDITEVVTWEVLAVTGASVLVFGIMISTVCVFLSVNRYLRMPTRRLYRA